MLLKVEQLVSFHLINRTPSKLNSNTYCKNLMAKTTPSLFAKVRCLGSKHQKAHNTLLLKEGRVRTLEITLERFESF